jgi:hypothetical protein
MKKIYNVVVSYRGFDPARDKNILSSLERRDRRLFGGSGFSFVDGSRDLSFDTYHKEIAKRLQTNLRNVLKKNKIRGRVEIFSGDI